MSNLLMVAAASALAAALGDLTAVGIYAPAARPVASLAASQTDEAFSEPGNPPGAVRGVFDKWLNANAPQCVAISEIGSVSHLAKLSPEQFQFARALYIAIPPISRELPPGDSAFVAFADGKAMVALVADGQTCARFLAPDFVLAMLAEVGRGETGLIGQPI